MNLKEGMAAAAKINPFKSCHRHLPDSDGAQGSLDPHRGAIWVASCGSKHWQATRTNGTLNEDVTHDERAMDSESEEFKRWVEEYRPPNQDAWINNLAIRSFRDIGDGDYIAARLALRAKLPSQFLWAALQAIEKYLKCILLLNRVSSKDVGHDITLGLEKVNGIPLFDLRLPKNEREVFDHVASSQGDRYLVMSLTLFAHQLSALDSLVWRLRQYCDPLDVEHYNDLPSQVVLARNLARIKENLNGEPPAGYLERGFLEQVLATENHAAREPLVWRNAHFGGNAPLVPQNALSGLMIINSPLYLHPEIVTPISKLIQLPRGALRAFEALAAEKKT